MCKEELMIILEENECIVYPDLEDALIGFTQTFDGNVVALYDYDKIISIYMDGDGMTYEEAVECCDFNVLGGYVGAKSPMVANLIEKESDCFWEEVE
jgi:hypothetical protein